MRYLWCLLTTLLLGVTCSQQLVAQNQITQTVRGAVYDSETHQPLPGTTISLYQDQTAQNSASTDQAGAFRIEAVPVGRYLIKATFVGYEPYTGHVLLQAGKETVLEITLTETATNLEEVVVEGRVANSIQTIDPVSSYTFTVEETRRYAATFFDPARLATSLPGVVGVNDQGNHIAVRGNSPNSLLWRLEGVDIVNPNHLSNAGTFSDRRVQNSGSQSILSTQVLDNSTFLTGAFPARYGNAIGGVFDMHLRKGNNQQKEYTAQLGLIGLEFAAEGPFNENSKNSYLANYRYSTVGLLTNLGLDFGGEQITFQDLSFNLSFPTENAGEFTVFGVGGLGSNIFQAQRDSANWEEQKDRYDITFNNDMGALGMTHTLSFGNMLWKTTLASSALSSTRFGNRLGDTYDTIRTESDEYLEMRVSATSSLTRKLGGGNNLSGGVYLNRLYYRLSSMDITLRPEGDLLEGDGSGLLVQPYVSGQYHLLPALQLNAGLHYTYFSFNGSQAVEPRASLLWTMSPLQSLTFSYGLHSQLQLPGVYFYAEQQPGGSFTNPNKDLGLTKAHHYVLSYRRLFGESASVRLEGYYQSLFNVPISANPNSTFSTLNLFEGFVDEPLVNEGTGKNYGVELTVEKSLTDSYYVLFSSSLYNSKYTAADGIQRDTRYNGNYVFSLTTGKEFSWDKKDKKRVVGVNLRGVYMGGLRVTPINVDASLQQQQTVFENDLAYAEQLPAYFKFDLRLSLRKNKENYNSVLSLDLQNTFNQQNVAFQYYDAVQGDIITKYQLGLIPILTYRIEF